MALPADFLKHERQRVFEPPPDFALRVMSQLAARPQPTLWESVAGSTRPMLAFALVLLLALISLELLVPAAPSRGLTQIYADSEIPVAEKLLYLEPEIPTSTVVLQQLVAEDFE
jgi:hypothetical protein